MAGRRKLLLGHGTERLAVEVERREGELAIWRGDAHQVFGVEQGYLTLDGRVVPYVVHRQGTRLQVWVAGHTNSLEVLPDDAVGSARPDVQGDVLAPMPGTILKVQVQPGDEVQPHQTLVVMESMKMELSVAAVAAGRVTRVQCQPGELVEANAVLVKLEASHATP